LFRDVEAYTRPVSGQIKVNFSKKLICAPVRPAGPAFYDVDLVLDNIMCTFHNTR
jgi:hypothetical protein